MMKIALAAAYLVLLIFWTMVGLGIGVSIWLANDQWPDALIIGGFAGIFYTAFTVLAVVSAIDVWRGRS